MGDHLGDVTGIIDFDFTDRKLFVTDIEPGGFVDGGIPAQETTALGNDSRSLTVATFNVENLDPGDGAARFTALANAIANNLNAPDIISIEEMQDNNGATASGGADASTTWQMLVDALNAADRRQLSVGRPGADHGAEGGEPGGNIRVGFLYNTDRVQLGDLDANATLAERRSIPTGSATASATPATSSPSPTTCSAPRSTPPTGRARAARCSASSPSTAIRSTSPPTTSRPRAARANSGSSTRISTTGDPDQ